MIAVTFRASDGKVHEAKVPKQVALRDLQRGLCAIFGASFPAMQANLEVGGQTYDEFDDMPFADCARHCESQPQDLCSMCPCGMKADTGIAFERTTNPFWLDWIDRRELKCTLEEQIAYDDALRLDDISLDLRACLREHRAADHKLAAVEPFPV